MKTASYTLNEIVPLLRRECVMESIDLVRCRWTPSCCGDVLCCGDAVFHDMVTAVNDRIPVDLEVDPSSDLFVFVVFM